MLKENNIINLGGLGPGDAKHIADALKSGKCPQGLSIILGYNDLDPGDAKQIADALKSGKCPQGLSIDLWGNDFGPGGAKHIYNAVAQAIKHKSLPYGVCINGLSDEVSVMLKSYNDSLRRV